MGFRYFILSIALLFSACGSDQTNLSDEITRLQQQIPVEEKARFSDFDWDAFFARMDRSHQAGNLTREEVSLDRSFSNYWKGLAENYPANDQRASIAITHFDRELKKLGIDLVVVWVPNPIDLHASPLSAEAVPENVSIQPALSQLFLKLAQDGVNVIDLRAPFRETKEGDPMEQWDHHWSSAGIKIAARVTAARLGDIQNRDLSRFARRMREIPKDTSSEEMLPDNFQAGTHEVEEILLDGEPIGKTEGAPILVLGDSMVSHLSKEKPHGVAADFTAHLSAEIGIPLNWQNRNGGAQLAPIDFIRDHLVPGKTLPQTVVWVISGNRFSPGSWSIVDFPEGTEIFKMQHEESKETAAFTALVRSLNQEEEIRIPDDLTSSDYPDVALAARFTIRGSMDPSAPEVGTEAVIYQWIMKDRVIIPDVPIVGERANWMWLRTKDAAENETTELKTARILNDELYPLDLPRYWRID